MYEQAETLLRDLARTEPLLERARQMTDAPGPNDPNGIRMVRVVSVDKDADQAILDVHFYNLNYLATILARYNAVNSRARSIFPISGGSRLRAGAAAGQV